jgi:hypothetical protein
MKMKELDAAVEWLFFGERICAERKEGYRRAAAIMQGRGMHDDARFLLFLMGDTKDAGIPKRVKKAS